MKDAILTFWQRVTHPGESRRSVEARAIYFAASAATLSACAAYIFFMVVDDAGVAIFGRGSVATASIILATIAAVVGYFIAAYSAQPRTPKAPLRSQIYDIGAPLVLSLIHGFIVFLFTAIVLYVVDDAFKGLLLDPYASTVIVTAIAAVMSYVVYLVGARVSTVNIANALAVFLVTGVLISMITANDPYWWTLHLSSLGANSGVSGWAFELTLAVGGAVVACLAAFLAQDFTRLQQHSDHYADARVRTIQTLLALIGLFLACVGLFEYDIYPVVHNGSASGMVVLFLILILGLPRLVPGVSYAFLGFSYVLMIALVICGILYGFVGYLNLTAFEIVSFAIVFSWLVVFVRQIDAALRDATSKRRKIV